MKVELDRRQNPTLLESLQDYYDKKTQGRPPLPNFYAEMKRKGKKDVYKRQGIYQRTENYSYRL